jgi:predicted nucleotidyltransferase
MDRTPQLDEILTVIRTHADDLRRRGVLRMAVFGSVARGEARPDSDVDLMIDLDRTNVPDLFSYIGIEMDLAEWIGRQVHLAVRDGLRPYVRPEVERDAIYAF